MEKMLLIPVWFNRLLTRNQGRIPKLILMGLVFITALYTKNYQGDYQPLINNHIGGIFYVLFGALGISVIFPNLKALAPALMALGLTCLLEVIQWFHFSFMLELTKNKVLEYLFGNSFNPVDFIYYLIGAVVGWVVVALLNEGRGEGVKGGMGEEVNR
jgi:hypothetical protein